MEIRKYVPIFNNKRSGIIFSDFIFLDPLVTGGGAVVKKGVTG